MGIVPLLPEGLVIDQVGEALGEGSDELGLVAEAFDEVQGGVELAGVKGGLTRC
jgi:hypothetical protein